LTELSFFFECVLYSSNNFVIDLKFIRDETIWRYIDTLSLIVYILSFFGMLFSTLAKYLVFFSMFIILIAFDLRIQPLTLVSFISVSCSYFSNICFIIFSWSWDWLFNIISKLCIHCVNSVSCLFSNFYLQLE